MKIGISMTTCLYIYAFLTCVSSNDLSAEHTVVLRDTIFAKAIAKEYPGCIIGKSRLDTICASRIESLYLGDDRLEDIDGIQYFRNLKELVLNHTCVSYLPILPSGLKSLIVQDDYLIEVAHPLPEHISHLSFVNCRLKTLDYLPPYLVELAFSGRNVETLPDLPESIVDLRLGGNASVIPEILPPNLRYLALKISMKRIEPKLPNSIQQLFLNCCSLEELPDTLPSELWQLQISYNKIRAIKSLPPKLNVILAESNQIESLPEELPDSLQHILMSNNRLRRLPKKLPEKLRSLEVGGNCLENPPAPPPIYESWEVYPNRNDCEE